MLINRLMHRWVLMQEAGGGDGGAAGSGGAASGSAGNGAASSSGAAAGAGTAGNAGAGSGAAVAEGAQSGQASGTQGAGASPLSPPASLIGEQPPESGAEPKPAEPTEPEKPIEYADFKLPEGVEVNAEQLAAFKEAAAGAKLSQEQAQAFVDLHQKAIDAAATKPYEMWRDMQKQWQDQIKADPEFGGAKLETETLPAIARAIKQFSPNAEAEKSLRAAFSFTGAGNNPEMIRFLARVGMTLKEGTHVSGSPTSGDGGKSAAQKLYPSAGSGSGQAQS